MTPSNFNLAAFQEHVRLAPTDAHSESVVRNMLEKAAAHCPVGMLVRLGQCLADCRRAELQSEAGSN